MNRSSFILAGSAALAVATTPATAADELRVAFIPEVATTAASMAEKQPFVDYLQSRVGRRVKLIVPTNYAATVEAIGNGGTDVAHFGALTYVKARARYGVDPVVQRLEDRRFHALFITAMPGIAKLADLKGKTFAFGDINSTSGHLIPAQEMLAAGIDPDHDITARFTGNHTATALAVNAGQVVAGGLDETVYAKLVADKTIDGAKTRVFHTSPPFVDYVWAVRHDLDDDTRTALRKAFLELRDPKVLAILRATYYVTATDREYDTIRTTARAIGLL